jgi:hypothetical protein
MGVAVFLNLLFVVFGLAFLLWAVLQLFNVAYEVQHAQLVEAEASKSDSQSRPPLKRVASSSHSSRLSMASSRSQEVGRESTDAVELAPLPDHASAEIVSENSESIAPIPPSVVVVPTSMTEPLLSQSEPALTTPRSTSTAFTPMSTDTWLSVEDTLEAVLAAKSIPSPRASPGESAATDITAPVTEAVWKEVQSKDGTMYGKNARHGSSTVYLPSAAHLFMELDCC